MAARLILIIVSLTISNVTVPEDLDELTAFCSGCHGIDGVSAIPVVPTLAGQPYTLIEDNLLAFRAGLRSCSPERMEQNPAGLLTQTMCGFVANLDDSEIAELSTHFEKQTFRPANQDFDPTLAIRGAEIHRDKGCERCHSDGGRTTNQMAPILAGQWTPYLQRTLTAVREGLRSGPTLMNSGIEELDQEDANALLNFYASQQD